MNRREVDILIIGAGPSGTVAAAMVAKAGLKALIVEKQKFPRFVIGESLLPKCMEALDEAGLISAIGDQGFQKKLGARFLKGDAICDFQFSEQFSEGWSWTWQVPRSDFDKTLADEVERKGVEILYEHSVTGITFDGSNSVTNVTDPEGNTLSISARFVIDSSGFGRVLPRLLGLDRPSGMTERSAMFTHIAQPSGQDHHQEDIVSIIVHQKNVWAWTIPFSNGYTSVGFVGKPEWFDTFSEETDMASRFRKMIQSEPLLAGGYHTRDFAFEPKFMKGFSSSVSQLYGKGFALTGNSAEFLDPVFSSGVTFAVESGLLAGKMASREVKGEMVDWENDYSEYIKSGVDVFRTYVNAWYDGTLEEIFFSSQAAFNVQIREQVCSVLAGYVWDNKNAYVRRHKKALTTLAKVINMLEETA